MEDMVSIVAEFQGIGEKMWGVWVAEWRR
jgi:hypothetical protein